MGFCRLRGRDFAGTEARRPVSIGICTIQGCSFSTNTASIHCAWKHDTQLDAWQDTCGNTSLRPQNASWIYFGYEKAPLQFKR